jgi:periplasmic copper chaperone A
MNMKKINYLSAALILVALNSTAFAKNNDAGNFELKQGWVRQTLQENSNTAAYGILSSQKDCMDVQVKSDAASTEIHQMLMNNGMMQMQAVKPFAVKAKQATDLLGPYHIMMMSVKQTLNVGQKVKISISCANPLMPAQDFMLDVKSIKATNKAKAHAAKTSAMAHEHEHEHGHDHKHEQVKP